MLLAAFIFEIVFTIGFPILLAIWLIRRFKTGWGLFWVGVATFIGSQIVHIPLLYGLTALFKGMNLNFTAQTGLIFNAVVLGLTAGLCEETARWVGYKLLKAKGKPFGAALTLAAGHGGIESILLAGVVVLVNLVIMLLVSANSPLLASLPASVMGQFQSSAASFWGLSPALPLAGAFERLSAISLHVALSVGVWLAVTRHNAWWYVAAVVWHAIVDGVTVYLSGIKILTAWGLEGVIAIFAVLGVIFVVWVCRKNKSKEEAFPTTVMSPTEPIQAN
jgi:uncharacterized membrane protein YhfC